jgi:hypothetical protein
MAWVRIDDQAPRNHKLLKAGPAAAWMWVCGIAHCQAHLSEGFIAEIAVPMIGVAGATRAKKLADVLVTVGLFERVDGGYRVHDYHDFNETKAEALARKTALAATRAIVGRLGGIASGVARRKQANAKQVLEPKRSPIPSHPIPVRTKNPPTPLSAKGGRLTRKDLQEAKAIRSRAHGGCRHEPRCESFDACVRAIAGARKAQPS